MRPMLLARRLLTLLVVLPALGLLPGVAGAAAPPGTTSQDMWFPSADGTLLHADVIRKTGVPMTEKQPIIMAIGPYFGHGGLEVTDYDPTATPPNYYYTELFEEGHWADRGYTFVQVDLRGFGGSEGCNDFGGKGEQADVKAAVEWAASQPWSTGKVGLFGKSYDGWTLAMALATKPQGLGAIVIQAPIIDGYRTLYQNGVHYSAGWYVTPALYQSGDALPPTVNDSAAYIQHSALGLNPVCYALNIALQTALTDKDDAAGFWKERDLLPAASGSTVPTFWEHGFLDANAKPDNFLDLYTTLKGPKRVWAGEYEHDRPTYDLVGHKGFYPEAMRWFDRYVKGMSPAEAPVENDPGAVIEDGGLSKWRAEAQWPPADAVVHDLTLRPGSVQDIPGNSGAGTGIQGLTGGATGQGIWSISQKLPHDVHLAGTPRVKLKVGVTAPTHVFAILYDIDEKGLAQVMSRAAYNVKSSGDVAFDLYPQDWTFKAGHRVALLMAQSDDEWFNPVPTLMKADIESGSLSLPFLRYVRDTYLPGRRTKAEEDRTAPFAVGSALSSSDALLDLPPAMTPAPPVVVAKTPVAKVRLTVTMKRRSARVVVARGTAPAGTKLTVRFIAAKTFKVRHVTVGRSGRWTLTLKARRKLRVSVTAAGGARVATRKRV